MLRTKNIKEAKKTLIDTKFSNKKGMHSEDMFQRDLLQFKF